MVFYCFCIYNRLFWPWVVPAERIIRSLIISQESDVKCVWAWKRERGWVCNPRWSGGTYSTVLLCRNSTCASVCEHVWGKPCVPAEILISWAGGEMKECEDYCLVIVSRTQQCCYISNWRPFFATHARMWTHTYCSASQGYGMCARTEPAAMELQQNGQCLEVKPAE